jgi:hypothetical protein
MADNRAKAFAQMSAAIKAKTGIEVAPEPGSWAAFNQSLTAKINATRTGLGLPPVAEEIPPPMSGLGGLGAPGGARQYLAGDPIALTPAAPGTSTIAPAPPVDPRLPPSVFEPTIDDRFRLGGEEVGRRFGAFGDSLSDLTLGALNRDLESSARGKIAGAPSLTAPDPNEIIVAAPRPSLGTRARAFGEDIGMSASNVGSLARTFAPEIPGAIARAPAVIDDAKRQLAYGATFQPAVEAYDLVQRGDQAFRAGDETSAGRAYADAAGQGAMFAANALGIAGDLAAGLGPFRAEEAGSAIAKGFGWRPPVGAGGRAPDLADEIPPGLPRATDMGRSDARIPRSAAVNENDPFALDAVDGLSARPLTGYRNADAILKEYGLGDLAGKRAEAWTSGDWNRARAVLGPDDMAEVETALTRRFEVEGMGDGRARGGRSEGPMDDYRPTSDPSARSQFPDAQMADEALPGPLPAADRARQRWGVNPDVALGVGALGAAAAADALDGEEEFNPWTVAPAVMIGGAVAARLAGLGNPKFQQALRGAEEAAANGATREEIWATYKARKNAAGNWETEASDRGMQLNLPAVASESDLRDRISMKRYKVPFSGISLNDTRKRASVINAARKARDVARAEGLPLEQVVDHPEVGALFEGSGYTVTRELDADGSVGGAISPAKKRIALQDPEDAFTVADWNAIAYGKPAPSRESIAATQRSTVVHELDHLLGIEDGAELVSNARNSAEVLADPRVAPIVQDLKDVKRALDEAGAAYGRSPDGTPENLDAFRAAEMYREELRGLVDDLNKATKQVAADRYYRDQYEVRARAAQARIDLTDEQRAARPIWLDEDVPVENQIVPRRIGDAVGSIEAQVPGPLPDAQPPNLRQEAYNIRNSVGARAREVMPLKLDEEKVWRLVEAASDAKDVTRARPVDILPERAKGQEMLDALSAAGVRFFKNEQEAFLRRFPPEKNATRKQVQAFIDDVASGKTFDGSLLPGRAVPSTIDEITGLEPAEKLAKETVFATNRDFKKTLDARFRERARANRVDLSEDTQATREYVARMALGDALHALKDNANAIGWYDDRVTKALSVLEEVHPEIASDANARFAFTVALALTSNGQKVNKNFELAEQAYQQFKATGRMPTNIQAGEAQKAINKSMRVFNDLVDQHGIDVVRDFLTKKHTVRDIQDFTGIRVKDGLLDEEVFGAAIFGPKIGNGFLMNLHGEFGQLTIDRWFMRTWGRWIGKLLEENPEMVAAKRVQLRSLIELLDPEDKRAFEAIIGRRMTVGDLDGVALAIRAASQDPDARDQMALIGRLGHNSRGLLDDVLGAGADDAERISVGDELRKGGNALWKYLDGQIEQPSGPPQRRQIREVMATVLRELQKENPDLTMADLQALLWYPEKRLYDFSKMTPEQVAEFEARAKAAGKGGYTDDDQPDYANAAVERATALGIDRARIDAALKRGDDRIAAGRRARSAGSGDRGLPASQGLSEPQGQPGSVDAAVPGPLTGGPGGSGGAGGSGQASAFGSGPYPAPHGFDLQAGRMSDAAKEFPGPYQAPHGFDLQTGGMADDVPGPLPVAGARRPKGEDIASIVAGAGAVAAGTTDASAEDGEGDESLANILQMAGVAAMAAPFFRGVKGAKGAARAAKRDEAIETAFNDLVETAGESAFADDAAVAAALAARGLPRNDRKAVAQVRALGEQHYGTQMQSGVRAPSVEGYAGPISNEPRDASVSPALETALDDAIEQLWQMDHHTQVTPDFMPDAITQALTRNGIPADDEAARAFLETQIRQHLVDALSGQKAPSQLAGGKRPRSDIANALATTGIGLAGTAAVIGADDARAEDGETPRQMDPLFGRPAINALDDGKPIISPAELKGQLTVVIAPGSGRSASAELQDGTPVRFGQVETADGRRYTTVARFEGDALNGRWTTVGIVGSREAYRPQSGPAGEQIVPQYEDQRADLPGPLVDMESYQGRQRAALATLGSVGMAFLGGRVARKLTSPRSYTREGLITLSRMAGGGLGGAAGQAALGGDAGDIAAGAFGGVTAGAIAGGVLDEGVRFLGPGATAIARDLRDNASRTIENGAARLRGEAEFIAPPMPNQRSIRSVSSSLQPRERQALAEISVTGSTKASEGTINYLLDAGMIERRDDRWALTMAGHDAFGASPQVRWSDPPQAGVRFTGDEVRPKSDIETMEEARNLYFARTERAGPAMRNVTPTPPTAIGGPGAPIVTPPTGRLPPGGGGPSPAPTPTPPQVIDGEARVMVYPPGGAGGRPGANVLDEPVSTPQGQGPQRWSSGDIEIENPAHAQAPSLYDPTIVVRQNPSANDLFEAVQLSMRDRLQPGTRWAVTNNGDLLAWDAHLATHADVEGAVDAFGAQGIIDGRDAALREQQVRAALEAAKRVREGKSIRPIDTAPRDDILPGPLNPGDRNLPETPGRGPIRQTLDTGRWNAQGLWDDGENLRLRHPITGLTFEQTQARASAVSPEPWTDYYPAREPMGQVPPAVIDDVVPPPIDALEAAPVVPGPLDGVSNYKMNQPAHGVSWQGRIGKGADAVKTLEFLAQNFPGFEGAQAAMGTVKKVGDKAKYAIDAIRNRYLEDASFREFMDKRFPALVAGFVGGGAAAGSLGSIGGDGEVPGPMM